MDQTSPTIAASPTMAVVRSLSSSSAVMEDKGDLFATSIALSVVLGLLLLGVSTWAGIAYRLQRIRARDERAEKGGGKPTPKGKDVETFSASNVCEKGLVRRLSSSSADSDNSGSTIRPNRPTSQAQFQDGQNRRVIFIDVPINTDSMLALHDNLYGYSTGGLRGDRSRSNTLSMIDRALVGPRNSSESWISTALEDIEEEGSILSSSSKGSIPATSAPSQRIEQAADTLRPNPIASTNYTESSYTTASCRSSRMDLTTLSTISCLSSFPETPRGGRFDIPAVESPSKPDRKSRARSQTVVNVMQLDLLRTAIRRTMSLHPSRQVVDALQLIADTEEEEGRKAL